MYDAKYWIGHVAVNIIKSILATAKLKHLIDEFIYRKCYSKLEGCINKQQPLHEGHKNFNVYLKLEWLKEREEC